MGLDFNDQPQALVRDAVVPFFEGFLRADRAGAHVFICHASEDKAAARSLASAMTRLGAEVWFDEWEIRVGESIVQKINDALGMVSHLIVLLSQNSIDKPWVQKEMSAALMRQLSREGIFVLPLRLDDCPIPPILADIKYADGRNGMDRALAELELALFPKVDSDEDA
jgi:predicted nucleotide-binding protein